MIGNFFNEPEWKNSLEWLFLFSDDNFPSSATSYRESLWGDWENRIQRGHDAEEKLLSKQRKELEGRNLTSEQREYVDHLGDSISDEYWQTCYLTKSMYAALTVTLWANVEHLLKNMIAICHGALSSNSRIPFEFGMIKKFFDHELSINLEIFVGYSTVDAVRILNNSFKHSDGYYKPKTDKPHTQIDPALLNDWGVLDNNNEIDYSKLPIMKLVLACSDFVQELRKAIESELPNRV